MRSTLTRLALSVLPLGLTPLLGYLIAGGRLNFGGGEKDIFLLIPWILWSSLYLGYFIRGWVLRASIKRCLLRAVSGATLTFGLMLLVMFIWLSARPAGAA